uniref:Uncharacterized protein n=1 Tax=Chenopodium quinoa TaxID=63459 RepID=A0A803MQV3_CHEQI
MDADVQQLSSEEEEIDSTTQDKGNGKNQKTSPGKPRVILTGKKRQRLMKMDFDSFSMEQSNVAIKSEVDMYYEEPLIPRGTNLDILSALKSETVEAIICLRDWDWDFGEDNMDPQMAMLCGSVMKLKVGDNDDAPQTSPELSEFDENASSNIV